MKTFEESEKSKKNVASLIKNGKNIPKKIIREQKKQIDYSAPQNGSEQSKVEIDCSELDINMKGDLKPIIAAPVLSTQKKSSLSGLFKGFSLNKEISEESLAKIIENLNKKLIGKNVAPEISEKICDGVKNELVGQKISSFSSIETVARNSMIKSCKDILNHNQQIRILSEIKLLEKTKPYVITFCGVNGVGKSTNLAKIAFWLIQNGFSVMICACDTFR